jgi:uncharacterized protein YecT (DUF1311 family)
MISHSLKAFMFIYLLSFSYGHASQAGKAYNDADKELNSTYQKVINLIKNPEEKNLIIESQKAWVRFRDAEVAFHAKYFPASKGGLFVATDMTEKRVQELKVLLTEESQHEHDAPFSE